MVKKPTYNLSKVESDALDKTLLNFEDLFRELYPAVCYFAIHLIQDTQAAEDIASEAFLKTWKKLEKLSTDQSFRAYLFQVARHDCYKWLRQQKRDAALQNDFGTEADLADQSHLELIVKAELLGRLHNEIQKLPTGCKKVIDQLYVEGRSIAETAKELKLAITTVKTQKLRGLAALRRNLGFD